MLLASLNRYRMALCLGVFVFNEFQFIMYYFPFVQHIREVKDEMTVINLIIFNDCDFAV